MNIMQNKQAHRLLLLAYLALPLGACGNAKEQLGIVKEAPDEFAVVRHAPLEMPASVILPPPRPGQPRPQETTTSVQAQQAIFGQTVQGETSISSSESSLLQQIGANQADPNIRNTIDAESYEMELKNRPVLDKLLMKTGKKVESTGETLDPHAEAERLRQQNLPTPQIPPEIVEQDKKKQ